MSERAEQRLVQQFVAQPAALGTHPIGEVADQWHDTVLAGSTPILGGKPVDLALDREDRIDAANRFDRQRRLAQIGQLEELAAPVTPAGSLGDRPRLALGIVEFAEPGVSIGLENPRIAGEMPDGMLAVAVARVAEDRCRRVRPAERPVIADIRP